MFGYDWAVALVQTPFYSILQYGNGVYITQYRGELNSILQYGNGGMNVHNTVQSTHFHDVLYDGCPSRHYK